MQEEEYRQKMLSCSEDEFKLEVEYVQEGLRDHPFGSPERENFEQDMLVVNEVIKQRAAVRA